MALTATFVLRRPDSAIGKQITVLEKVSKREPVATREVYGDIKEEPSNGSDTGS